jgi:hypothetical protein
MSSPIYNAIGRGMIPQNNIFSQLQQFRQQMQGRDPRQEINRLLQSGAISQQQLDQAQQMAMQMQNLFK